MVLLCIKVFLLIKSTDSPLTCLFTISIFDSAEVFAFIIEKLFPCWHYHDVHLH